MQSPKTHDGIQVCKAVLTMMSGIAETVIDQIVQLISACLDWDDVSAAENVQW